MNVPDDTNQSELNKLNFWLKIIVTLFICWSVGVLYYVKVKTENIIEKDIPVIVIDTQTGKLKNIGYSNLFHPTVISNIFSTNTLNTSTPSPMYIQKKTYDVLDFVIVNYFFVEGIVIERDGNNYTIMYKNHEHTLVRTIIPGSMLLVPTSNAGVSPVSLLVD